LIPVTERIVVRADQTELTPPATRAELCDLVIRACAEDVRAFKPGNVAVGAPGHGMHAEQFLRSAAAVAAPLSEPDAPVGARIEAAVAATWRTVGCNTNLGIVLLLAPLLHAAARAPAHAGLAGWRDAVRETLAALDIEDARATYRAIRQARPGGLGSAPEHDVADEPQINLLAAMQAAAARDGIAHEYASDFAQIFEHGVPTLQSALGHGEAELWAVTRCYLTLLARQQDGHVLRRNGAQMAAQVSAEAHALLRSWPYCGAASIWPALRDCDRRWKAAGINPGTSADLVVASTLVMRLQQSKGYNGCRHGPGAAVLRRRPESVASGKRAWAPSH
jgi:triphosphoribosyl-dephospho-CoA synthase